MRKTIIKSFFLLFGAGFIFACGSKAPGLGKTSKIEVRVRAIQKVSGQSVDVNMDIQAGTESLYSVTITNPGTGDLTIQKIDQEYQPVTSAEKSAGVPAFRLQNLPKANAVIAPIGMGTPDNPEKITFNVIFHRYDDEKPRTLKIFIMNDNQDNPSARRFVLIFSTILPKPELVVDPPEVDFDQVNAHATADKSITMKNNGSGKLELYGFYLRGDPVFSLNNGLHTYKLGAPTEAGIMFATPIVLNSGDITQWTVTFAPDTSDATFATLTILSNASKTKDSGLDIPITGNAHGPKLKVTPNPIAFGGVKQGTNGEIKVTLSSEGTDDVVITNIKIGSKTQEFQPDFSGLSTGGAPTIANPLTLHADPGAGNQAETFVLRYVPLDVSPQDASGKPILDTGKLKITMQTEVDVDVSGYGVSQTCPMPVIVIDEGEEVEPQTTLHLHGGQSVPSSGTIKSYNWSVDQPPDNKFQILPIAGAQDPTHEANVSGDYKYCLDVCDTAGKCSNDPDCNTTACKTVRVISKDGIHVELTWTTPGDPDPYDTGPDAGSDMDLHFAHPFASGPDIDGDGKPDPWFNIPYDCYWGNKHPQWESVNANIKDDPTLDRDDTDGAGPENLNLDVPKTGRVYRIGVHYWNDHGFGDSDPTIKIFIYGQKKAEFTASKSCGTVMHKHDMWTVATITWRGYESGTEPAIINMITGKDTPCKIAHNYVNPSVSDINY